MAAENLNKSKLKTYTSRKNTFTLITLQSLSISGVLSAEKMEVENWKIYRCLYDWGYNAYAQSNVCKFLTFRPAFSQVILHLKCWNFAGLLKQRCSFWCGYTFLILTNFNLFEFSAAILEKGLFQEENNALDYSASLYGLWLVKQGRINQSKCMV